MNSRILVNKTTDLLIVFTTILLYFNSRVDANIFKAIFILCLLIIMFRKFKNEFTINQSIVYFGLFVFFNIIFYPYLFLDNIFTLGYFLIILLMYYYYILENNIFRIINVYLVFAFLMAFIGIVQEVLFLYDSNLLFYLSKGKNPDFLYLPDIHILRVASLLDEPTKLGLYILPAILFGIVKYLYNIEYIRLSKFTFIILILAFILTFSAHAFLSLIISLFFLLNINLPNSKKLKFPFFFLFLISLPFILSLDVVSEKLINSGLFYKELDLESSTIGTSAFFYVGFQCALDIFQNFNLFGVGMGNYNILAQNYWAGLGLLRRDDGSNIGYVRILVEFGIIGFVLFIYFLYRTKINIKNVYNTKEVESLLIINYISLLFIVVDLFRMGFYINPPIIFFLALFMTSKIKYKLYMNRIVQ